MEEMCMTMTCVKNILEADDWLYEEDDEHTEMSPDKDHLKLELEILSSKCMRASSFQEVYSKKSLGSDRNDGWQRTHPLKANSFPRKNPLRNSFSRFRTTSTSFSGFMDVVKRRKSSLTEKSQKTFEDYDDVQSSTSNSSSLLSDDYSDDFGMLQQDLETYKSASFCIQHPVFVTSPKILFVSEQVDIKFFNLNSKIVSQSLSEYLLKIFRPITREKHNHYQAMLIPDGERPRCFVRAIAHQLTAQLQSLDQDRTKYYEENKFLRADSYQSWKKQELDELKKYLQLIGAEDDNLEVGSYSNFSGGVLSDYVSQFRILLDRIVLYEVEMRENIVEGRLLPPQAVRLLSEFSLRYRISEMTQRVFYLDILLERLQHVGNPIFLKETSLQMDKIMKLLSCENFKLPPIVIEERRILVSFTQEVINKLQSMMSSFNSNWQPSSQQMTDALSLIHSCYDLRKYFFPSEYFDYPDCLKIWFRTAVEGEYQHHKETILAKENSTFGAVQFFEPMHLYHILTSSISSFHNRREKNSRALFTPYLDEEVSSSIYCLVLMRCVVSDLREMEDIDADNMSRKNINGVLEIGKKLVELDELTARYYNDDVDPVDDPDDVDWRTSYHKILMRCLDPMEKMMQNWVQKCFIGDSIIECSSANNNNNSNSLTIATSCCTPQPSSHYDKLGLRTSKDVSASSETKESTDCEMLGEYETASSSGSTSCSSVKTTKFASSWCNSSPISSEHKPGTTSIDEIDQTTHLSACSFSLVRFVILVNRFLHLTSTVGKAIYCKNDCLNNKLDLPIMHDRFSAKVMKIVHHAINKFCNITMNQELKTVPNKLLGKEEIPERISALLPDKSLLKYGSCRQRDQNKRYRLLKRMAVRMNNLVLLKCGLNDIWCRLPKNSLTAAAKVNPKPTDLRPDSTAMRRNYWSGNLTTVALSQRQLSSHSNSQLSSQMDLNAVTTSAAVSMKNYSTMNLMGNSSSEFNVASQHCKLDLKREGISSRFDGQTSNGRCNRSLDAIFDTQHKAFKEKSYGTVDKSLTTLMDMYGYLMMERSCHTFSTVLQPSYFPNISFQQPSLLIEDVKTCEKQAHAFLLAVKRALTRIQCLHPTAVEKIWKIMWSAFAQEFCDKVKKLHSHRVRNLSLSFYFLVIFRKTAKIFSASQQRIPEMTYDVISTLSNLEIFLMPTDVVVDVLGNIEHQGCDLLTSFLSSEQIRILLREKKSFSGSELVYRIAKSKNASRSPINSEDVVKLCQAMLNENVIQLNSICESSLNHLPSLVYYNLENQNDETSSEDAKDDSSVFETSDRLLNESYSSYDTENDTDDENKFYHDENHHYIFTQLPSELSAFSFTRIDGTDLQPDDLIAILKLRSFNQDKDAKNYLRNNPTSNSLFYSLYRRIALRCF